MDTERTAAHLDAVAHKVVGHGAHLLGMLVEQRQVVGVGHGERMVRGHEALLLVAPLEEGEVDYPQTLEHILVTQPQAVAHLQAERAELHTGLVGIVAGEDEHEIAVFGSHGLFDFGQHLGRIELVDGALHRAVGLILDEHQSLGTHLRTLHEVGELVELLAAVIGTTGHADAADVGCLVEHGERSLAGKSLLQLDKLHAKAHVGFVRTVAAHGIVPLHALQRGQFHAANLLEEMAGHVFEDVEHVFLLHKRHFAVYLCELGLAVGPQVFVAETLGYLEVTVHAGHHEELLEGLRTLRQGIELAGIHARRHHEIAGPFGRAADEDGGLHLHELARVEEVAYEDGHAVAQLEILAHGGAANVEVAVFHADVVSAVGIVFDGERGGETRREHRERGDDYLDVARVHIRVFALPLAHTALDLNAVFAAQLVGLFTECPVVGFVEHELCDAVTVAQVDERHAAHLARTLNPAGQGHFRAGVGEAQLSACLCSVHNYISA